MKRMIRLLAALLAVLLTFSGCSLLFGSSLNDILFGDADLRSNGLTTFAELSYHRPDMDAIEAQYEKTIRMHSDGSSIRKLTAELNECYRLYQDFYTMDTLAELRYYQDMTGSYYAEEAAWCMEQETEMNRLFDELLIASANCDRANELESFWGESLMEEYKGSEGTDYDEEFEKLALQEAELLTKYRTTLSEATVKFDGREQSYRELCATDLTDEEYEQLTQLYYDKYTEELGRIYIDLVAVRQQQAEYLGFESFEELAYIWYYDRDYSPIQADALLQDIRTYIAPVYRDVNKRGLWDEIEYREMSENEVLSKIGMLASDLGGDVSESFDYMKKHGLYDISVSPKKMEMSYQTYLSTYESPVIFVKAEGFDDDCLAVAHEFGHFVDSYVNYDQTYSIELAEVFSHSMEYFLLCRLPQAGDLVRIKLLDTLDTYAQQASFAEFERRVYEIPAKELTVEKLNAISLETAQEFGFAEEGREDYYAKSWIDITHFFEYPFYVISYCVSNDVAFQIYQLELANKGDGLAQFNRLLPRDFNSFLDTIENQSDLQSPFDPDRMEQTAQTIRKLLSLD